MQLQRINNNSTAYDMLIKDVNMCYLQTKIQLVMCQTITKLKHQLIH